MSKNIRPLIAGNWKMHGLEASLAEARALAQALAAEPSAARVALCPPATLVRDMAKTLAGSAVSCFSWSSDSPISRPSASRWSS